jgi:glycosyltransferase involved in cell wall biosynthesis
MKISICIPQYNRIAFLVKSLERIKLQTFRDIEIVISDDCSTDDTEKQIRDLIPSYPFPVIYSRNAANIGYDANLRRSMELATGDYCFILGNDDSFNTPDSLQALVEFLEKNNYPEVGFCNMVEESSPDNVYGRAAQTGIIGKGYQVALQHYSCFSFVAGLVYKKDAFERFNTNKHDGSIYVQMYLAVVMISSGLRLFSVKEPIVLKDIIVGETVHRNTYRDRLPRKWKDFYIIHGGLPSVINVILSAFRDAGVPDKKVLFKIFKRIYLFTVPNWVFDYKSNKAFPAAIGIVAGMFPYRVNHFTSLNIFKQIFLLMEYSTTSFVSIMVPSTLFLKFKNRLYNFSKQH